MVCMIGNGTHVRDSVNKFSDPPPLGGMIALYINAFIAPVTDQQFRVNMFKILFVANR
jgi:hypothetical protein